MNYRGPESGKNMPIPGVTQTQLSPGRIMAAVFLVVFLGIGAVLWSLDSVFQERGFDFFGSFEEEDILALIFGIGVPIFVFVGILLSVKRGVEAFRAKQALLEDHFHRPKTSLSTQNPISQTDQAIKQATPEESLKALFDQFKDVFGDKKKTEKDETSIWSYIIWGYIVLNIIGAVIMSFIRSL